MREKLNLTHVSRLEIPFPLNQPEKNLPTQRNHGNLISPLPTVSCKGVSFYELPQNHKS